MANKHVSKSMQEKIKKLDASDERQYMLGADYEVYEKQGAPFGAASFHYHDFYEIIYVMEGEYSSLVGNQTYHLHRGDFLLIDQNVMHRYYYEKEDGFASKRIIVWVTDQLLKQLSIGKMDLTECFRRGESHAYHFPIYYEEMLRGYLLKLAMSEILEEELPDSKKVLDMGYLMLFFGYLNNLCYREENWALDQMLGQHPLVEQVTYYVEEHMTERITVEELAEYVHMSKYYFLRKFKELTGVTVHSFVTDKKLIHACELIKEGESISLIYQRCGFTDYSSFLRNFKKAYGVSPGKYGGNM